MSYEDKPIAFRADGSPIYDNAVSVVCVAVYEKGTSNLLVIRRNTNPGKGLIALPGGFQMRGETWEQTGSRELLEETGLLISPEKIYIENIFTDEYMHNVIIGKATFSCKHDIVSGVSSDIKNSEEVQEILYLNKKNFAFYAGQWAFTTHALSAHDIIFYD